MADMALSWRQVKKTASSSRVPVRLGGSGKKMAIKPENLLRLPAPQLASACPLRLHQEHSKSDDVMPPSEHVGEQEALPGQARQSRDEDTDSNSSMPLLEYFPEQSSSSVPRMPVTLHDLSLGEAVLLRGLKAAALNGQSATVAVAPDTTEHLVQVELVGTRQKLLVSWDNVQRIPAAEAEVSELATAVPVKPGKMLVHTEWSSGNSTASTDVIREQQVIGGAHGPATVQLNGSGAAPAAAAAAAVAALAAVATAVAGDMRREEKRCDFMR